MVPINKTGVLLVGGAFASLGLVTPNFVHMQAGVGVGDVVGGVGGGGGEMWRAQ